MGAISNARTSARFINVHAVFRQKKCLVRHSKPTFLAEDLAMKIEHSNINRMPHVNITYCKARLSCTDL